MALEQVGGGSSAGNGVAFLVGAAIVYEAIAANCSSPQTAELNAKSRAETLMKWVNIGAAQGVGLTVIASLYDKQHAKPILAGGLLTAGLMYALYTHAKVVGLQSTEPGTES